MFSESEGFQHVYIDTVAGSHLDLLFHRSVSSPTDRQPTSSRMLAEDLFRLRNAVSMRFVGIPSTPIPFSIVLEYLVSFLGKDSKQISI